MIVKEIKKYDIPLKFPKILADKLLDPKREQILEPLPNTHFTALFIGKPRSGKSTYAFSLISTKNAAYFKIFDNIHIVIPPDSLTSLGNNQIKNHKRIYHELTSETLNNINSDIDKLISEKKKDGNSLIIYDDVGSSVKNSDIQYNIQSMSWNFRHRLTTQWYLLQTLRSLPLPVRKCATILIIFNIGKVEQDLVYNEFMTFISKSQWEAILIHTYNVKKYGVHTALFINTDEQKIYRLTNNKYYLLEAS